MEEGCRNDFLSPPLEVAMDFVQPGSVKQSWQGTRCLADENHKCEMTKGRERERMTRVYKGRNIQQFTQYPCRSKLRAVKITSRGSLETSYLISQ